LLKGGGGSLPGDCVQDRDTGIGYNADPEEVAMGYWLEFIYFLPFAFLI